LDFDEPDYGVKEEDKDEKKVAFGLLIRKPRTTLID
jgi:hypothetical protein